MRCLLLSCMFFSLVAHSQEKRWQYGPSLGLSMYQLNGKGLRPSLAAGVQVGGFVWVSLSPRWKLGSELAFLQHNVRRASNFTTYYNLNGRTGSKNDFYLQYITVPFSVAYVLDEHWSVYTGPRFGYLFNSNENLVRNNRDAFRRDEWSADLGGEYRIERTAIYLRANKGISDINGIDGRYHWRSFSLQAGIKIGLH